VCVDIVGRSVVTAVGWVTWQHRHFPHPFKNDYCRRTWSTHRPKDVSNVADWSSTKFEACSVCCLWYRPELFNLLCCTYNFGNVPSAHVQNEIQYAELMVTKFYCNYVRNCLYLFVHHTEWKCTDDNTKNVRRLVGAVMNFRVHKMRGICWLAANQLASQEGLCTVE